MRTSVLSGATRLAIPRHACKDQSEPARARHSSKEETEPHEARENGETGIDEECKGRPGGAHGPHGDLNLLHEREHVRASASDRQTGVDPSLRPAFHQNASFETGGAKLLDGFGRTGAGLTNHIKRRRRIFAAAEAGDWVKRVEREQPNSVHMRAGMFGRGTHVEDLTGGAFRAKPMEVLRPDRLVRLRFGSIHAMNI